MKRSADILLQVLENIPDIFVLLIDRRGTISLAAGNELEQLGFSGPEITGKEISSVFDPSVSKALKPMLEVSSGGTVISHEMMIGEQYYFVQALPLKNAASRNFMANMVVFENLTEYKVNADKLRIAREAADKSNRLKSIFLANMSHEIRTPLNTIIGFSEQLNKLALTGEQARFLDVIRTSSDHLLSMVSKIITLSEIDAGEKNFEKRSFLIPDVIQEVLLMESKHAANKGISLEDVSTNRVSVPLFGDDVSLTQVLLNLVNNAIKFTSEGHVHVSAEVVDESERSMRLLLRVKDSGIGIPQDRLRMIFDDFSQADSNAAASHGGSGLGLTIASKLVNLQGGSIEVESEEGKGTEFFITMNYEKAGERKQVKKRRKQVDPEVLKDTSILYVDDDENNRLLGKVIFEGWGVDHDIASDGFSALKMAGGKDYDVVLLDMRMPEMDGLEVARELEKVYSSRPDRYSIIAVTANAIKKDIENYLRAGIDGFLLKPFRELDLYDTIVRHMLDEGLDDETSPGEFESNLRESMQVDHVDYDLSELRQVTAGNRIFFNKMVKTFISNASEDLLLMKQYLNKQEWKNVGELAHKMLPSYRHLHIVKLVKLLEDIEEICLSGKEHGSVAAMAEILHKKSLELFIALEKELK